MLMAPDFVAAEFNYLIVDVAVWRQFINKTKIGLHTIRTQANEQQQQPHTEISMIPSISWWCYGDIGLPTRDVFNDFSRVATSTHFLQEDVVSTPPRKTQEDDGVSGLIERRLTQRIWRQIGTHRWTISLDTRL